LNRHELSGHSRAAGNTAFIFDQRQVIAEAVPSFWIVKHFDLIEDILLCFFPSAVGLAPDSLPFQELKEALGYGFIVEVPAPAHTLLQVMLIQEVPPVIAAERATLIGMLGISAHRDQPFRPIVTDFTSLPKRAVT